MAHEIESIMSVKLTPWHGLGVILPEAPNAETAIKEAGLDWTVTKRKVWYERDNGEQDVAKGQYAVVRDSDDRYMGYAGESWQPLQNTDAFKFFDPFIESGEATFETAGSLDHGRRIWVLAKINRNPIEVVKGDIVDKYILLSNHHSAGYAVRGALTPIRVVCANTEAMAFNNSKTQIFKATHSLKMNERLERVQQSISMADSAFEQTAEFYKRFASKQVLQNDVQRFVNMAFGYADVVNSGREEAFKRKQTETIVRLFETGRGSDILGVRGTVWGLYNAATEFLSHENGKTSEKILNSNWFGNGSKLNKSAFEAAMVLAS